MINGVHQWINDQAEFLVGGQLGVGQYILCCLAYRFLIGHGNDGWRCWCCYRGFFGRG
jgi:hypothetical protein